MSVDYVSTAPWNDPYNPWPQYSEVIFKMIGGSEGGADFTCLYTLSTFNPLQNITNYATFSANALYVDLAALALGTENTLLYQINLHPSLLVQNFWQVNVLLYETRVRAYKADASRSVPVKSAGSAQGWIPQAGFEPYSVNDMSIIPVTTALTPWELREEEDC